MDTTVMQGIIDAGALGVVVLIILLVYSIGTRLSSVLAVHLEGQRELMASSIDLHTTTHNRLLAIETQLAVLTKFVEDYDRRKAAKAAQQTKKVMTCSSQ